MADGHEVIEAQAVNFDELAKAFHDAPDDTYKFVKQNLFRFARRVRRKLISERMQGAPGIKGGKLAKGGNVQAWQGGTDLASLKSVNKITRILVAHEEGATITPGPGKAFLFLSRKTGVKGKGFIFARVRSVKIPARLGFQALWLRETPQAEAEIADSMQRAMRIAMERHMRVFSSAAASFANL